MTCEIDALVFLEFGHDETDNRIVPVVTTELGVAIGGQNFEHAVANFQHGDVKRATAEVIDCDFLIGLFIKTVSE